MSTNEQFIPIGKVAEITTLSPQTLKRMETKGTFPRSHKIGGRRIAWLESDVDEWICCVIRGQGDSEILEGNLT